MTRLVWLAALALGCGGDDDGKTPTPGTSGSGVPAADALEIRQNVFKTDKDGYLTVDVEVLPTQHSFMLTGDSELYVTIEQVIDPAGEVVLDWQDWWDSDEYLTNAVYGIDPTTAVNWPVRTEDGPLEPGTWQVVLSTQNGAFYAPDTNVTVYTHLKNDSNFDAGVVRARVVYAKGVDEDAAVVDAVEQAVERWREVWDAYGLILVERYDSSNLEADLSFAYEGGQKVENEAAEGLDSELMLVVGEQIDNDTETQGVAGGVPGTLMASKLSFVVVSWLAHAGIDGEFSEEEIRQMGETMAHEMGHYMGLFHPVEWNYNAWDALDDTPKCDNWYDCEEQLGNNNMFPYPICDMIFCERTDELTPAQVGVAHQYVGTL